MIVWGLIPAIVALGTIVLSVFFMSRGPGILQILLGVPTILISAFSLIVLKRIFLDRAWPTYLPHVGIGVCVMLVLVQCLVAPARPPN